MEPPPPSHSFVVKIWAKEGKDSGRDGAWRGRVTHVHSGEHQYVENLLQISALLVPYVTQMGGQVDLHTRLCLWLAASSSARRSS